MTETEVKPTEPVQEGQAKQPQNNQKQQKGQQKQQKEQKEQGQQNQQKGQQKQQKEQGQQNQQKGQQKQQNQKDQNKKQQKQQNPDQQQKQKPQNQKQQQNSKQANQQQGKASDSQPKEAEIVVQKDKTAIEQLFPHIPCVAPISSQEILSIAEKANPNMQVHPSFIKFILTTCYDLTIDENEKCRKFLKTISEMVDDLPVEPRINQSILDIIKFSMKILTQIRVTTPGISNCVRFIKSQLTLLSIQDGAKKFKEDLLDVIEAFSAERIDESANKLSKIIGENISNDDIILTYGYSPIIFNAFKTARELQKSFKVIILDNSPISKSRSMIEEVDGLDVRYVLVSGVSYIMPEVKKVWIEPCGILSNNAALTTAGTAMISMVAHDFNIPVVFVCPCYRFVPDVRVDSLSKNERVDSKLVKSFNQEKVEGVEFFSLCYDITPAEFVNTVIYEIGNNPVNSISTNMVFIQDQYVLSYRK
ncbi:Initiation factor 2 subunit family protein [Trichomonas vaginalis G3]|uniref:Translation initiation factor eIF2B subunit delta n=1 Tax=Trichomonas vaginalis (strain ATCC PRA-98 / G3) TaxID=412133 RepID=A2D876_TRIV3|nr:eIF-2b alpha beta delta subunits family [Trichomonas vaginalis G3]EAY23509.1 Initiation factor 2 subunit family protein [Trichomonas vaginalis G3]KAI5493931.1 eIF-2b alpha beta delta subunits family [Trichomonas vaginalis G3]|eukprot:XP_001584495.1 Initiation factor 2 subunit family protein [Trichomonas vaginalis G3]